MIDLSVARRQARAWSWVLIAIVTAAGAALVYVLSPRHSRATAAAPARAAAVPVVVATVVRRNLPVVIEGIGTVQAYNTVTVAPLISGRLAEIDFVEGQQVRPGEILARLDSRLLAAQLREARAVRLRDEAKLKYGRANLQRIESVSAQGFVSRDLLDAQKAQVAVIQATVAADRAAERNAQVELSYTIIRAPIAGVTGIRMVDKGNVISSAGPGIVVITQVRPIAVIFTLPGSSLGGIPDGESRTHLPVSAFDAADHKQLAKGTLALVDNRIDPGTNTIRLKAIFPNASGTLRPGEFVNLHLRLSLLRAVLTVPTQTVRYGTGGSFVWRLRRDSTVEPRPVAVGASAGDLVQVVRGLAAGDKVVLEGHYGLHAGTPVAEHARALTPLVGSGLLQVP